MLRLPMRLHNPMSANSRFCLPMRLTLYKSRSNPPQACPLQGDFTECFALGNVGFALESYSTSQPQWIHLSLSTILREGWFYLSGSQIYLHIVTHAVGKYSFTCCLGMGINKSLKRQSSISEGLSRQRQCPETAQKVQCYLGLGVATGLAWNLCHVIPISVPPTPY